MAVTEIFANLVLALFGLIGCTQGGRGQDPLVVLAEMLGISAEQLYREVGLFVMGNYHDISALDTGNKGLDYYVCGQGEELEYSGGPAEKYRRAPNTAPTEAALRPSSHRDGVAIEPPGQRRACQDPAH
ncbi:hypothetical protein Tcan_07883 [Toxocara canis]|uniref:Uncharacterized protein n=1 Tax=Toxocara canis TaxID=6265 RepID=A0A0B2VX06_TOXCA|nr:hypothetical protein Tcan_07883 [Toxocara canis]